MSEGNETENAEKKSRWLPLAAFWGCAFLGTSAGGGLFGAFAGPPGIVIGFCIAGAVGGPIHLAACLLTLFGPLVRFRRWVAAIAGSVTGVFSVHAAMRDDGLVESTNTALIIAAIIGGVATWFVTRWFARESWLKHHRNQIFPTANRFTLFETFYFVTVVALISIVVAAVVRP